MRKEKKPVISHEDIAKAIKKFKDHGGLIKRLPDQIVVKGVMVGGEWGMYEPVYDPAQAGVSAPAAEAPVAAPTAE